MSDPARREWKAGQHGQSRATKAATEDERVAQMKQTAPAQSTSDAVESLERTVRRFESAVDALQSRTDEVATGPSHATGDVLAGLERVLAQLSAEAQRLAAVAGRLEALLAALAARDPTAQPSQRAAALRHEPAEEPRFSPGAQPLGMVVGNVPGFQGLMELQRRVSELAGIESASVAAYRNGQATLKLVLAQPVGAREIADGVGEIDGHSLVIEESRPEELRLRLRFVTASGSLLAGGSLRVEFPSSPPR